jgi:uncharacterized repeat protein (TIGR03803 family)
MAKAEMPWLLPAWGSQRSRPGRDPRKEQRYTNDNQNERKNAKEDQHMTKRAGLLIFAGALAVLVGAVSSSAQTLTTLYNFSGDEGYGYPLGLIKGPSGSLIGTTAYPGIVFQMIPPAAPGGAWTENTIYAFDTSPGAPYDPGGILIRSGAIYGAAGAGGDACSRGSSCGAAFKLTPPATPGDPWTEETLYSFSGEDGSGPSMLVPAANGGFYGITLYGGGGPCVNGRTQGCGTVFQLSPPAAPGDPWTETVLYAFQGGADSANPVTLITGNNGDLIGTTYPVTEGDDHGTVFELKPPATDGAWTKSLLYRFSGTNDGIWPIGNLIQAKDGAIYGACAGGGETGFGTVYQLSPASEVPWTEQILHTFQGNSDGSYPQSGLIAGPGGTYLGTTTGSYSSQAVLTDGTVFRLDPPATTGGAWTETVLYDFVSASVGNGILPYEIVMGGNELLYGITNGGGTNLSGTLFELSY